MSLKNLLLDRQISLLESKFSKDLSETTFNEIKYKWDRTFAINNVTKAEEL